MSWWFIAAIVFALLGPIALILCGLGSSRARLADDATGWAVLAFLSAMACEAIAAVLVVIGLFAQLFAYLLP